MLAVFQPPREQQSTSQASVRKGVFPDIIHAEQVFSPDTASYGRQPHFSFALRKTERSKHFSPCAVAYRLRRTFRVPRYQSDLHISILPVSGSKPGKEKPPILSWILRLSFRLPGFCLSTKTAYHRHAFLSRKKTANPDFLSGIKNRQHKMNSCEKNTHGDCIVSRMQT